MLPLDPMVTDKYFQHLIQPGIMSVYFLLLNGIQKEKRPAFIKFVKEKQRFPNQFDSL